INERKVFLRPRPIKLHARLFFDTLRPNVADNAYDLTRYAGAGHHQCLTYRVFAGKNFLRAGLADQHDVLTVDVVMLVKLASSKKRDPPRLEEIRRHIMTRRSRAL